MNASRFPRAIIASALIAATTAVQAGPNRDSHDSASIVRARVVASEPVYQTVNEPRTECWTESVSYENPRHRNEGSGGAIVGAIAGGLLGSTVGKGNGRVAAAAVGAATGAVIGDRMDDRMDSRSDGRRQVERCKTIDNPHRVINAYDVRYRYQGRDYSTQLPYDPGRFIKLRVSVAVAEDQREGNDQHGYQRDDERDNHRDDR